MRATTELGRSILSDSAEGVRRAVVAFAKRRGWTVIDHGAFVNWAVQEALQQEFGWLVLDPLIQVSGSSRMRRCQLTRTYEPNQGRAAGWQGGIEAWDGFGASVGVIDDAVSSGRTMLRVGTSIAPYRTSIKSVVVCASTHLARIEILSRHPQSKWNQFLPGDWRVIHLRDGCPYLPYSGRPIQPETKPDACEPQVNVRVPPMAIEGNLWQVLWLDHGIRTAIEWAREAVPLGLMHALGRRALVRDLMRLGTCVPATIFSSEFLNQDSCLPSGASSNAQ
jgi:hypothetical protein